MSSPTVAHIQSQTNIYTLPKRINKIGISQKNSHTRMSTYECLPKQFIDKWTWMELLQFVNVFTRANKQNGALGGSNCTDGATALGVTVHFGNNDTSNIDSVFECFCLVTCRL